MRPLSLSLPTRPRSLARDGPPVSDEQQFTIQPHPAKSNDPSDLKDSRQAEQTSGLGGAPNLEYLHKAQADPSGGKGPHILSDEIRQGLEQPKSKEELDKRQKELNA